MYCRGAHHDDEITALSPNAELPSSLHPSSQTLLAARGGLAIDHDQTLPACCATNQQSTTATPPEDEPDDDLGGTFLFIYNLL
jgi:hypothetical protein